MRKKNSISDGVGEFWGNIEINYNSNMSEMLEYEQ